MRYLAFIAAALLSVTAASIRQDAWTLYRHESFDNPAVLTNLQAFGRDGWLTAEIRNDADITISNGMAHFVTANFPGQALLRITETLPDEFKIQVRLGKINFSYLDYEEDDYEDPNFRYTPRRAENGFYWAILSDSKCEGEFGEDFWHSHRKAGMDSDDHGSPWHHTKTPLYMVYSNKTAYEDVETVGSAYRPDGRLKSTYISLWRQGSIEWNRRPKWDWDVAYVYDPNSWYWAEIEKSNGTVTLRLYDGDKNLLEETAPIDQELIWGMGTTASPEEYFYLGEPHVDSYEGDAYVDEILFYVVDDSLVAQPWAWRTPIAVLALLSFVALWCACKFIPMFKRSKTTKQ